MFEVYIDREEKTIMYGNKTRNYSYFSYLNSYIKYGGDNGDEVINLPVEYEIYINGKLRWSK